MGDYVNFLRKFGVTGSAAANAQALFNQLYDRSHGSDRYWMSNTPWGLMRKLEDKAKRAQDEYDNTKKDPAYSDHYDSAASGVVSGLAGGIGSRLPGMARSLAAMYTAEVSEDVSKAGKNMDRPEFG